MLTICSFLIIILNQEAGFAAVYIGRQTLTMEPGNSKKILIADDEEVIRKLFQMVLSRSLEDCEFEAVSDGSEAVKKFQEGHHGTILMDVHMPNTDGIQALYQINEFCEQNRWEKPACIFCTGFATPQSLQNVIAANPKHCVLYKPVKNEILVEALKIRTGNE